MNILEKARRMCRHADNLHAVFIVLAIIGIVGVYLSAWAGS